MTVADGQKCVERKLCSVHIVWNLLTACAELSLRRIVLCSVKHRAQIVFVLSVEGLGVLFCCFRRSLNLVQKR